MASRRRTFQVGGRGSAKALVKVQAWGPDSSILLAIVRTLAFALSEIEVIRKC